MLLPEPRLDTLIDQLRAMRPRDRRAVLAWLGAEERNRVRALLRRDPTAAAPVAAPFSPDIAARIAALDTGGPHGLASAAGEALAKTLDQDRTRKAPPKRAASLVDTLATLVGSRRSLP